MQVVRGTAYYSSHPAWESVPGSQQPQIYHSEYDTSFPSPLSEPQFPHVQRWAVTYIVLPVVPCGALTKLDYPMTQDVTPVWLNLTNIQKSSLYFTSPLKSEENAPDPGVGTAPPHTPLCIYLYLHHWLKVSINYLISPSRPGMFPRKLRNPPWTLLRLPGACTVGLRDKFCLCLPNIPIPPQTSTPGDLARAMVGELDP
ncbi:unnamed protein product [Rangifer tarandus platyrhynchus]|uniref:Uncharacterized protein n=2 Tax=Rangifer tarandus platyrhynchus TaxID=3082113 RepID=A0ABN8YWX4_RANTA|nr:unnamed protein product [Rangifer tarandus platyrhynchus]